MEFKQLTVTDAEQFLELIKNMYEHLENQEWFSPMPLDIESIKGMIEKPRFFIVGAFENDKLCGVSSIDYKCGKLVGKVDFPKCCDTDKMVEIAFNIVHSEARGKGLMSKMVDFLLKKLKQDGFTCAFAKVNKDNFASSKSLQKLGFEPFAKLDKPVDINAFRFIAEQPFFNEVGKRNAEISLSKCKPEDVEFFVDYILYYTML